MVGLDICGVVTLYNPTDVHISNIGTYIGALGVLYVIDNSRFQNEELLSEIKRRYDKVEFLSCGRNLGIAAALNLAMRRAEDDGYELLMTMDQDSYFEDEQYRKYIKSLTELSFEQVAIASPVQIISEYVDSNRVIFERTEDVATSGNVINLRVARKIGLFNEELFIDSVDHDYCLRANILGYHIVHSHNCYLCHCIGEQYSGTFFSIKKKNFFIHSPKRMYFIVRNALYIKNRYGSSFPDYVSAYMRRTFERASKCIRYSHRRWEYLRYIMMALCDYSLGRYGNRVNI
ncbi:MAG TPA: glycosyltransferase [Chlorobaculum sp.]|nr:glycosyltransferase [Chlorobaculum sp.]